MKYSVIVFVLFILIPAIYSQQNSINDKSIYYYSQNNNELENSHKLSIGKVLLINKQNSEKTNNFRPHIFTKNGNEREIYTYTETGSLLTYTLLKLVGSQWTNICQQRYFYGSSSLIDSFYYEEWSNNTWKPIERAIYTYENGRVIEDLQHHFISNEWKIYLKITTQYNSLGQIEIERYEDGQTGNWVFLWDETYIYDNNGNILVILKKFMRYNGTFGFYRITQSYNASNYILTEESESSDDGVIYKKLHRYTYTYDAYNRMLTELYEYGVGSVYENFYKRNYVYNNAGQLEYYSDQKWEAPVWWNTQTITNTYSYGRLVKSIYAEGRGANYSEGINDYVYNSSGKLDYVYFTKKIGGNIINEYRSIYTYNTDDLVSLTLNEKRTNGVWGNVNRVSYSYQNLNIVEKFTEKWQNNSWVNDIKESYQFDLYNNTTKAEYKIFNGSGWVYSEYWLTLHYNDLNDSLAFNASIMEVEYSSLTDVKSNYLAPMNYALSQNYPNPFNPSTTIKYSVPVLSNVVIKLYNSLGQEVRILLNEEKTAGSYELKVNLSDLSSGVYFYRLSSGSNIQTKKMMLIK